MPRAELGDRLLGGQQLVVRRGKLGDRGAPCLLGGCSGGDGRLDFLAGGPVGHRGEGRSCRLELLLLTLKGRGELGFAGGDRIDPSLDADQLLARFLPHGGSRASHLLGLPVARFGGAHGGASGLLLIAIGRERRLRGSRSSPRFAEGSAGGLLATPMRCDHQRTSPGAERVVLLLVLRLHRQPSHLRFELAQQVADAGEVIERASQPAGCLVALHLEALDAGGLLEELASLLRPQGESRIDGSLPHHDELVRPEPTLPEQLDHVAQARARAVDQVLALP